MSAQESDSDKGSAKAKVIKNGVVDYRYFNGNKGASAYAVISKKDPGVIGCFLAPREPDGDAAWVIKLMVNRPWLFLRIVGESERYFPAIPPLAFEPTVALFRPSTPGRPSEARVPARYGRATSLVERGIGGGFGSRLPRSVGFSAAEDCAPRSAPRTVPRLIRSEELAAGSIPDTDCGTGMTWSPLVRPYRTPWIISSAALSARFERGGGGHLPLIACSGHLARGHPSRTTVLSNTSDIIMMFSSERGVAVHASCIA
ncbi:hypothetical protein MRX96_033105 [Rhipicephalus microplus]